MRNTVKVPSLNDGRNELPNVAASTSDAAVSAPAPASTELRRRIAQRSSGSYRRFSQRTRAPSPCAPPWPNANARANASLHSAGVTESATTSDARIDTM